MTGIVQGEQMRGKRFRHRAAFVTHRRPLAYWKNASRGRQLLRWSLRCANTIAFDFDDSSGGVARPVAPLWVHGSKSPHLVEELRTGSDEPVALGSGFGSAGPARLGVGCSLAI